ncbi:MAG: cell surface protein [Hungatella sp.]|nr:cell surface protein [Hungatella sp.]
MRGRDIFRGLFLILAAAGMMVSGFGTAFGSDTASEILVREFYRQQIEAGGQSPYLEVDGIRYDGDIIVTDKLEVLISEKLWKRAFGTAVLEYPDSHILLHGGEIRAELQIGENSMVIGQQYHSLTDGPKKIGDQLYLPLEAAEQAFGYERDWKVGSPKICVTSLYNRKILRVSGRKRMLPNRYDYREEGRAPTVKNQGEHGTCWSFASLTALESSGRPKWERQFSEDHMSLRNSFGLEQEEGGDYTMSMAYLLAWQGPVLEEEDPYGDGVSPEGLKPSVHVQEIRILPEKDYDAIKEAVFLYGGVQSSLYTAMTDGQSESRYYNKKEHVYCYIGDLLPNHDVVIVGWDDHFPKEKIGERAEGDGAFLCVNSWGEEFGEEGYFYVSYYDQYIGSTNLVYTGVEEADDRKSIYQSDLCGWVGQIGYDDRDEIYGANIYEARGEEQLYGAGFYATQKDTSYEIYVAVDVKDQSDLAKGKLAAKGTVKDAGYYTISLNEPKMLKSGQRFAVILHVKSPGAVHPMAVEYQADDVTRTAIMTDGEGYISPDGKIWESAEQQYKCNLCLKGYTRQ